MWYKESNFRNLVDMHIPDWNPDFMTKFDPEHYADCMAAAGVDTALVYAGNCLGICFFPTKYGHMHEGLHGRDIIRETLDALRARDIRPIVYFNIWSRWAYETHPEWRMRTADGGTPRGGAEGKHAAGSGAGWSAEGTGTSGVFTSVAGAMKPIFPPIHTAIQSVPFTSAPRSVNCGGR